MYTHPDFPALTDLDDYHLVNDDQDVRGQPLFTRTGRRLGIVERMLVDRDQERVAALVLDDGGAIPVEEVEIQDGRVLVDHAPPVTPAARKAGAPARAGGEEVRVPIVEEQVAVGKRAVDRGHIRVRSRVVEKPVHEEVRLREERLDVDRRAVNKPAANPDGLFQERTVEVTATSEEPVVEKRAQVTEEVVVRKEVGERIAGVDETVRKTEVDVQRDPKPTRRPDGKPT